MKITDVLTMTLLGLVLVPVRTVFSPSRERRRGRRWRAVAPSRS